MSNQKDQPFVEAQLDEQGNLVYDVQTRPDAENAEVCLAKVPDRIVPVVFLPGIMGSNLRGVEKYEEESIWRVDGVHTLFFWIFKGAKARRNLLNPATVQVDPRGKIKSNNKEKKYFASRRERGWGEVGRFNYGKFLHWFQGELLEIGQKPSAEGKGLRHQWRKGHQVKQENNDESASEGAALKSEIALALCGDEVALSCRYLLPLHVVGYNWLASNADSAARVAKKVDKIIDSYCAKGQKCEQVILVTHSMGGLVARHYSENLGGKDKIMGILHGVIPAQGAATSYQRMKMGMGQSGFEGFFVNHIIGKDAEEMTAVMSQSPGALQLLPGTEYGSGWLQIKEQGATHCLPVSDPYTEIYTTKNWWGLCDPELMNPNNNLAEKDQLQKDWDSYVDTMDEDVQPFIEKLARKYHPNTHAFYGTGQPSYEQVTWKLQSKEELKRSACSSAESRSSSVLVASLAQPTRANQYSTRNKKSTRQVVWPTKEGSTAEQEGLQTYKLLPGTESGDGTVAERSAKLRDDQCESQLPVDMLKHEPAYDNKRSREYSLAAIIKIIQTVNQTGLKDD